jgi:hypothetical protein
VGREYKKINIFLDISGDSKHFSFLKRRRKNRLPGRRGDPPIIFSQHHKSFTFCN